MRLSLAFSFLAVWAACALAATHQLEIDTAKTKDSKFAIATFIENNINFGTDGGLYAELIRNRAFQEKGDASFWSAVGSASIRQTTSKPLSTAVPNSVIVSPNGKGSFGLKNTGYFGIPIKAQTYRVSFYARAEQPAKVTAKAGLYSASDNKQRASVDVPLELTTQWKQFSADLVSKTSISGSDNTFGLTFPEGTKAVQLNFISVFPPTYEDTTGRNDLTKALFNLKAPYTRLPGGNQLEGNQISEFWNWSKRVGPLTERPSLPSVWAGVDTGGYGLHEALDLFEKLGSEPILGVYAGYSLNQASVAEKDLKPYVQLAVDELHYIKDAQGSSAQARRREKNGRAQPWKLDIVEIGNEDWLGQAPIDTYGYRYNAFHKALVAEFPDVLYLASSPYSTDKSKLAGIDQHDYNTPQFAYAQFRTHDSWPRNGTQIMELEYAVINNGRCGQAPAADLYNNDCRLQSPTLEAALSEGAWTMGFERNGDLVTAAAYAPLFHNSGPSASQWSPDLISFNHETVALSPSYWVQYGFGNNRIDKILAADLKQGGTPGPIYWSAGTLQGQPKKLSLKLVNSESSSQTVSVNLAGQGKFAGSKATTWGFSGKDRDATNTVEHPNSIVPKTGSVSVKGNSLEVQMPAYSFQIVTVDLQ
ncbi:unnamed protein product [Parajaminaea phylloscopi]